jgi:dUTP pyrophosphatase
MYLKFLKPERIRVEEGVLTADELGVENPGGIFFPKNPGDAGYDLAVARPYNLVPGEVIKMHVGVAVEFPEGTYGQLLVRSSFGSKGVVLASSGLIDNGYRGFLMAPVVNVGRQSVLVEAGERVIQMVIHQTFTPSPWQVARLSPTVRGESGFGSTGKR